MKAILNTTEHGFSDYDVRGLINVHRACVPATVKRGDIFNVYCADGVKLGATWSGSIEMSLAEFADAHPGYKEVVSKASAGSDGQHDWCIGEQCNDGFPVFIDDRQLGYRKSFQLAQAYVTNVLDRLLADGDYRLNDKPAGFLPPAVVPEDWKPCCSPYRHGGWYVNNVQYASGAIGCVSNNYIDKKWRIVCDPRRADLGGLGDHTFPTRDAAAKAEYVLANS